MHNLEVRGTATTSSQQPLPDIQEANVTPELKVALKALRHVRSRRPDDSAGPLAFADWRDDIADALDALSRHLIFEDDRARAAAEAAEAREQAIRIRATVSGKTDDAGDEDTRGWPDNTRGSGSVGR